MSNKKTGKVIVISSPSGAGKDTILRKIHAQYPDIEKSLTVTTRKMRDGEIDGKDYLFKTTEEFERMIEADEFIEYAHICDNCYGIPKKYVYDVLNTGRDLILKIDWQGLRTIKEKLQDVEIKSIYITPPSIEELKRRLELRGGDKNIIKKRLDDAEDNLIHQEEYDYIVVNDDLDKATQEVLEIIKS